MKSWQRLLSSLTLPLFLYGASASAAYPEQPVRLIAPYGAGGSSDVLARALSEQLAKELGQPVIVENRAGAGSMIGTSYVAGAAPDGYTLLLVDVPFTIIPALYPDRVKYDVSKDFAPVALLGVAPMYLFVHQDSPIKTYQDLIETAKKNPGQLSIGSGGNGSFTHLLAELLMSNTGIKLTHVPYKSAAASVTDLAGRQIDASFTTIASAKALIDGGKIRPIASTSMEPHPATPDVPTFHAGGLDTLNVQSWWGIVAPAGTPAAIISRLESALAAALPDPSVQQRFATVGVSPPQSHGAAALQTAVTEDLARWKDVISKAGISAE